MILIQVIIPQFNHSHTFLLPGPLFWKVQQPQIDSARVRTPASGVWMVCRHGCVDDVNLVIEERSLCFWFAMQSNCTVLYLLLVARNLGCFFFDGVPDPQWPSANMHSMQPDIQ